MYQRVRVNIQNPRRLTLTVVKGDVICPAFGGCRGAATPRGRRGAFDPAFLHALNELCHQAEVHAVTPPGGQAASCLIPGSPAALTLETKSQGCDHVPVMCANAQPATDPGIILYNI